MITDKQIDRLFVLKDVLARNEDDELRQELDYLEDLYTTDPMWNEA